MLLCRIRTLLAALWLGLVVTLGAAVAPTLFAMLERTEAGRIAGQLFRIEAHAGLGLAVALFLIERRLASLRMAAGRGSVVSLGLLLVPMFAADWFLPRWASLSLYAAIGLPLAWFLGTLFWVFFTHESQRAGR